MIFKIVLTASVSALLALSFKKRHEHISVLIVVAATLMISAFMLSSLMSAFDDVAALFSMSGLNASYLKMLLKCLGISLLASLAGDICEDAGYQSLASQIILAGKMCILLLCLPLYKDVLEICIGLIKG